MRERVYKRKKERERVCVCELRTQAWLSEKKLVTFLKGTLKRLLSQHRNERERDGIEMSKQFIQIFFPAL